MLFRYDEAVGSILTAVKFAISAASLAALACRLCSGILSYCLRERQCALPVRWQEVEERLSVEVHVDW